MFKQVNPSKLGEIINKNKIVSKSISGYNRGRTPQINMHQFNGEMVTDAFFLPSSDDNVQLHLWTENENVK